MRVPLLIILYQLLNIFIYFYILNLFKVLSYTLYFKEHFFRKEYNF